jgi:single-strand DNA-binding protein
MSASLNKVLIIGNLGADPEYKSVESLNANVARLRIATTESYVNKDGQRVDNTEWHTVNLWRGLADTAHKYLKKGDKVYIEGKLRTRSWEDQGQKKSVTEIEALNMIMLGGPRSTSGATNSPGYSEQSMTSDSNTMASGNFVADSQDDDLPF